MLSDSHQQIQVIKVYIKQFNPPSPLPLLVQELTESTSLSTKCCLLKVPQSLFFRPWVSLCLFS